jgi:hypothetical protein
MPQVPEEVILEQYQLKSTFFAEKLDSLGFFSFINKIKKIIDDSGDTYNWDDRAQWGIDEDVWNKIQSSALDPLQVFCHP